MMSNGALIPIGMVGLLGTWGFLKSAATPGATASTTFAYVGAGIFASIALACAAGVAYNVKKSRYNRKHKIYKSRTSVSLSKTALQQPEDWRSRLADFDLGRLNLAGWTLSFCSLIVFFIVAGISGGYLESQGIKQASTEQIKVFGTISLGVTVAFFMAGKWVLEQCNIKIFKY